MVKMCKWKMIALLCLLFSITSVLVTYAAEEMPITVWLDGEMLTFDTQPILESDRTLVPMRAIFEALGAEVSWEQETLTAIAVKEDTKIEITIDEPNMRKNGEEIALDVPARLLSDYTLVPVRAISESFSATVDWQGDTRRVLITSAPQQLEQEPEEQEPVETSPADEIAPDETEGEPYQQLSPEDMQKLKDSYAASIRYSFEQSTLPADVLEADDVLAGVISSKSVLAQDLVYETWNQMVIAAILRIQIESETNYLIDADTEESLQAGILKVAEDAGLEAHQVFDVTFETLADKSVMLLVTFHETDTIAACKYIGVVVQPDENIRYFTAETDVLYTDALFFCEVTTEGRGTIGNIGFEKSDFLEAANLVLEKGFGI